MADAVIQLRDLQARHAELQAASREKDAELRSLREIAEAANALQTQDVQIARIIDLSKKNRQLQLQVEKEKARASKLQTDLNAVGKSKSGAAAAGALDPAAVEGIARKVVEQAAEAAENATKQAEMWKERCQQNTNKISQLEQKVFALEIEAKKLTRALTREVGDDVPLSKVIEEGSSDWKGRREQIIALRHQVQTLKAAQGLVPEGRHEAAAKKVLSKVAGSKNAELEQLKVDLGAARQEAEAARTKAEGLMSRRKILEAELSSLKEKVSIVLRKSHNDDQLIAALRAELALLRKNAAEPTASSSRPTRPPVEEDDELWRELSALRRRCAEQRAQVERYEATVQSLNDRLSAATAAAASSTSAAGTAGAGASCSRGGTPPWNGAARRPSSGIGSCGRASGQLPSRGGTPPDHPEQSDTRGDFSAVQGYAGAGASSQGRSSREEGGTVERAGASTALARAPSARGLTPVEVREGAVDQQLRLAQVEVSRLQELVQLLHKRVQELEDELESGQERA